ncbi:helix-hairpin-helix domain-containing protein [Candidatus Oscillochloris fontis]|uniref:helix-hairpin-helix domain-containing protein n=1 Tax=Candidatus Oscillochloris fontis TaxID=2496868 RepID=UPI00101C63E9|nr:helix-hairpin-helix domain-containing protein [Candidatus Oscillochloris fontis]
MSTKKIGVLVGREWSWPPAFIEEVNRRNAGVIAEFIKIGGTRMAEVCEYDVIIDRISHEIPYYRTFLKTAALSGTRVINNPFWWSADDKFFGASLCTNLGIPHPKTIALPSHSYTDGITEEALRNLRYPIPWQDHVEYVGGFPAILKPITNGDFKRVYKINNFDELWRAYNDTGAECMMLQEYIAWEKYVRCIVIGQEHVMTIKFDANAAWPNRYFRDDHYLTLEEGYLVVDNALRINRALGYEMNTVEFAIKDGIPFAIDLTNPAPNFDVNALTPHYFDWVVKTMADVTISMALAGRNQPKEYAWSQMIGGGAICTEASTKHNRGEDLALINGVGPAYARRLGDAGITTFAQLAETSVDQVRAIIGPTKLPINAEAWVAEATLRAGRNL